MTHSHVHLFHRLRQGTKNRHQQFLVSKDHGGGCQVVAAGYAFIFKQLCHHASLCRIRGCINDMPFTGGWFMSARRALLQGAAEDTPVLPDEKRCLVLRVIHEKVVIIPIEICNTQTFQMKEQVFFAGIQGVETYYVPSPALRHIQFSCDCLLSHLAAKHSVTGHAAGLQCLSVPVIKRTEFLPDRPEF